MHVRVAQLCKRYGRFQAIENVSFEIAPGEVVGLLGPNGAGKSTTLRILTGLLPACSGSAWVCGTPVNLNPEKARQEIGYMPENNPLPDELYVREYLTYRAYLKDVPARKIPHEVGRVMEACELQGKVIEKPLGSLSKGYRQRVGIADTLLGSPKVMILDEPTVGLDPHQVLSIRRLIAQSKGQASVLLCSHILSEVQAACDRVLILNHGQIVASGSYSELCTLFFPKKRYQLRAQGRGLASLEKQLKPLKIQILKQDPDPEGWQNWILEPTPALPPSEAHSFEALGIMLWEALRPLEGVQVASLTPLAPNLESIFLRATQKNWPKRRLKDET